MTMKTFACQFCVFVLLIAVGVNAISLTSCSDALENEVCGITCNTSDHLQNVAFYKLPDTGSVIAQCVPGSGCFGPSQYDIAQPNSVSTILSFMHSRQQASEWRCDYGLNFAVVNVSWATYPQNVSTTMTSNTQVNADIHVNATLECLYSAQNPTVTLQYENSNGKIDATSETFKCEDTPVACTDGNFTTYACPVIIATESGINHSDAYSIQLKTTVSNVQREDVKTIATGITFGRPTTTTEQQTTTDQQATTEQQTTTHETTTKKTKDGSTDYVPIFIGTVFVVIVLITIIIIVLFKNRNNKRDQAKTTKQVNSNKTSELTENKLDTVECYGYAT